MTEERARARTTPRASIAVIVGVAVIGLLWIVAARPTKGVDQAHDDPAAIAQAPAAHAAVRRSHAPPTAPRPDRRAAEAAFEARPFAGPGRDDPAGPGMLPHPITAEHLRIYRDVDLLEGTFAALKRRDFARARSLLDQHAREYASGYDDLQDGLSILADCMETSSAEARERAQRFYDQHTESTARRKIRRHCLERVPAPQRMTAALR